MSKNSLKLNENQNDSKKYKKTKKEIKKEIETVPPVLTKLKGFIEVHKALNRKMIPTCHKCHQKIHKGEYNDIALNDLYDKFVASL